MHTSMLLRLVAVFLAIALAGCGAKYVEDRQGGDELIVGRLSSSTCHSTGVIQGTQSWDACILRAHPIYSAHPLLMNVQFVQGVMEINQKAFERCSSYSLHQGTPEFRRRSRITESVDKGTSLSA